jgi:hypothetical protein
MFRPALGSTQPPTQWEPGALSSGVKRLWGEADHSPPASAEVKKIWIYTSTPPYAFMAQCLIRYAQGQLYLYLYREIMWQSAVNRQADPAGGKMLLASTRTVPCSGLWRSRQDSSLHTLTLSLTYFRNTISKVTANRSYAYICISWSLPLFLYSLVAAWHQDRLSDWASVVTKLWGIFQLERSRLSERT